jgi:hypothetical protein
MMNTEVLGKNAPFLKKLKNSNIPFKNNKKISNYNNSMINELVKFQLLKDSKAPSSEWCISQNPNRQRQWSKTKKATSSGGIGIPCGKVNGMFVVDLDDYKWDDDHPFIKKFGKGDYHKKFDTFVQQSAGGAWHLFFNYDDEFFNKCHHGTGIDILSDRDEQGTYKGKYVVGAGTTIRFTDDMRKKYNSTANYGTYKILNDRPFSDCPDELKQWLRDFIYVDKDVIRKKTERSNKVIAVSNSADYYKYNLSEDKVENILKKLFKIAPKYFQEYRSGEDWSYLVFTTAMKSIGHYKMWDKYSKLYAKPNQYNKSENDTIWNGITKHHEYNCFNRILNVIDERTLLDYVKYKPTYDEELHYSNTGCWDKLGKHIKIPHVDIQIKSGTGTGKTTIVKDYLKATNKPFISIVSRRSLAYEQYKTFQEHGLDCVWYEHYDGEKLPLNTNVVIQIDSIMKIHAYLPYSNEYTIFLDEYSSLLEHLITSPTLNKSRSIVFKVFKKLLASCEQLICVDADLTKHTLDFLTLCGRPLNVWNNTFQHNKGVPAKEWLNIETMVADMKTKDKFMMCLDSKTAALSIAEKHFNCKALEHFDDQTVIINGKEVNKYEMTVFEDEKGLILVVSAENDYIPNLDEWDRVIFSPKIVYGLDSIMEREVYCIYKENTISPKAMMQQVARCRNIIQLNYMFCKKTFTEPNFIDVLEVANANDKRLEFVDWIEVCDDIDVEFYKKILSQIHYNDDCYKTNKFVHFKNMLREKGFIGVQDWVVCQTSTKDLSKIEAEHKQMEIDNFDCDKPNYQKRNELLQVPKEEMKTYCQLFINDTSFTQYRNVRKYLINGTDVINSALAEKEDFNVNKCNAAEYKIVLMQKFLKAVGAVDKINFRSQKQLTKEEGDHWYGCLDTAFRFRLVKESRPDFTKKEEVDKVVIKCFKQLFGANFKLKNDASNDEKFTKTDLIMKTRTTIDGKRSTTYKFNDEFFSDVSKVISFSHGSDFLWNDYTSLENSQSELLIDV